MQYDVKILLETIDEMQEALLPFVKEATQWRDFSDDEFLVEGFPGIDESSITVGDLRRARMAYWGASLAKEKHS